MLKVLPGSDPDSIAFTLIQLQKVYEETNNPVYGMFAFKYCFERSVQPPDWVMSFVAVSFHDYISNAGLKSLDSCFLVKVSNGKTPPMKMFLLDERDDMIMNEMYKLVEFMELSMEVAASMVKEKLVASDWNKTFIELPELTEGSIKDMYRKKYRKQYLDLKYSIDNPDQYFPLESRIEFIDSFPKHCIPHGLKESLSVPRPE